MNQKITLFYRKLTLLLLSLILFPFFCSANMIILPIFLFLIPAAWPVILIVLLVVSLFEATIFKFFLFDKFLKLFKISFLANFITTVLGLGLISLIIYWRIDLFIDNYFNIINAPLLFIVFFICTFLIESIIFKFFIKTNKWSRVLLASFFSNSLSYLALAFFVFCIINSAIEGLGILIIFIVWILLAILLIIIGKVLRGFFRKRKIEKNENVKGSNKNIKISIFIIANIVFSVMMLAKVEWHDKNQYIYDLIPLVYPTINLVCLFCWNKTKNINIKRIISIFNIVLSVLIIFLFLGGLLFSAFDDSSKNIIDALVGLILIILPICSINIFKGDNHKIKKINNINN